MQRNKVKRVWNETKDQQLMTELKFLGELSQTSEIPAQTCEKKMTFCLVLEVITILWGEEQLNRSLLLKTQTVLVLSNKRRCTT